MKLRITSAIMLERLQTKFPKLSFNMEKFKTQTEGKITISCPKHGDTFTTSRSCLQSKYGCSECAKDAIGESNSEDCNIAISRIKNKYKDTILIPSNFVDVYKNMTTKVTFICPTHGEFERSTEKLLIAGQTCSECKLEKAIKEGKLPGGYCETIFSRNDLLKNKPGYLYHMKVGDYHKIGITVDIKNRSRAIKSLSKLQTIVVTHIKLPLYEAYLLEQKVIAEMGKYRADVNWSTEVFTVDLAECIKNKLKEYNEN